MDQSLKKAILGPMRLPFLTLPPVCVLLGLASAVWTGFTINYVHFALAFLGAVAAHVSVNALNEYGDFISGLDFKTEATPFSGGSKTLPDLPDKAPVALITGIVSAVITAGIGLYFWKIRGAGILPLGIVGLIVVITYTKFLTKNPVLCLIAPGLGFGTLMVMGTDFVLTGSYSWTALVVSFVPFFLVSNLLLLNQFPDVAADRSIGRKHIPVLKGTKFSVRIYGLFLALTYLTIIVGYVTHTMPIEGLFGLATLFLAVPVFKGVMDYYDDIPKLIPFMGKNVVLILTTPLLVALGLLIG